MKRLIKGIWYIITAQKRFRVKYYEFGRYSKLMTYQQANSYAEIFGGEVCIDYNKQLLQ